jgi:hypothetical protein
MRPCQLSSRSSTCGTSRNRIGSLSATLAFLLAAGLLAAHVTAKTIFAESSQKKGKKDRALNWEPPLVDAPIPALSATPPCSLPDVLKQSGERAKELVDHLENFTAHERIRYQQTDRGGEFEMSVTANYDYGVDFGGQSGQFSIHETRQSLPGNNDDEANAILDKGLPVLALIFYPAIQSDYEMRCEGFAQWNSQPAWVVYFRQIKGKVPRTMTIRSPTKVYPLALKGRAWIGVDSGQVMHLETSLVEGIPMIDLKVNTVVVDYAPVKFQSQNTEMWLPQFTMAYTDYTKRRMIIEHTFSDFQLFSVQTEQKIQKPQ